MLKQILSKIPRKSAKLEQLDSGEIESANNSSNTGSPCTSGGNSFSNRLSVVKRVSSAVFPASVMAGLEAVEPHLLFKDVSILQKQNLFLSKLNYCCEVSDISDIDMNVDRQDLKRQVLMDLVDFVSAGSAKFNEPSIAAMCKMCAVNLFRVFPPKYLSNSSGRETEHEEPIFDPAWPHLQLVYDFFLKFVDSVDVKVAKKHVNHSFILKILDLFDSEDPRERDCLKTLLHRVYGKFMLHRPFIRKAVGNIIYQFVFETECHNGIAELLEVFGSVISGFAVPLKDEHKMFLQRALIPLHKPKSMGIYHQQLTYSIVQFVDKDPQLASIVIKGLLKYWPITNSQKEMMFISELEEILEITPMDVFQKIMDPLFRRLGSCLYSSHYQVAERAHLLWNNERILNLVSKNRQVIMPLVFPALERNAQSHWNRAVINLTLNTKKMFTEMDEELALSCERKLLEQDSMISTLAEKRRLIWERLEIAASFKPVAGSGTIVPPVKSITYSIAC